MKSFEVRRTIPAPAAAVWAVLTDAATLASGGFGILRLEGRIAPGERLKLWSEVDPERAFVLRVVTFQPPLRMVWRGGMPFGLFTGERSFALAETARGCDFHMREAFSGPLSGPIARAMPDLQPSFEKFADALARATRE